MGLLIIGGAIKGRYRSFHLYTLSVTAYLYIATMSKERFLLLKIFLRFNDRRHRDPADLLSPVRDIWTIFNEKLSQYYTPEADLTADEQLLEYHGRVKFQIYISSKSGKYQDPVSL